MHTNHLGILLQLSSDSVDPGWVWDSGLEIFNKLPGHLQTTLSNQVQSTLQFKFRGVYAVSKFVTLQFNSLPTGLQPLSWPLPSKAIIILSSWTHRSSEEKKSQNKSLCYLKSFSGFPQRDLPLNSLTWFQDHTSSGFSVILLGPLRPALPGSALYKILWPPWTCSTSPTLVPHLLVPYLGSLTWNKFFVHLLLFLCKLNQHFRHCWTPSHTLPNWGQFSLKSRQSPIFCE